MSITFFTKKRYIFNSINRTSTQAASATKTICRHFLAVNPSFCGFQRTCLYASAALGTLLFVNSDTKNAESLSYPRNKAKGAYELTKWAVDRE